MSVQWPRRIYKRRSVWHWLADAGAPEWMWCLATRSWWAACSGCGRRMRFKGYCRGGGGLPIGGQKFCTTACADTLPSERERRDG
jgi:hypothetical protein